LKQIFFFGRFPYPVKNEIKIFSKLNVEYDKKNEETQMFF